MQRILFAARRLPLQTARCGGRGVLAPPESAGFLFSPTAQNHNFHSSSCVLERRIGEISNSNKKKRKPSPKERRERRKRREVAARKAEKKEQMLGNNAWIVREMQGKDEDDYCEMQDFDQPERHVMMMRAGASLEGLALQWTLPSVSPSDSQAVKDVAEALRRADGDA